MIGEEVSDASMVAGYSPAYSPEAIMEGEAQYFTGCWHDGLKFFLAIGTAPPGAACTIAVVFITMRTVSGLPRIVESVATDPTGTVAMAQWVGSLIFVPDKVIRFVHHVPQPLLSALDLLRTVRCERKKICTSFFV